MLKNINDLISLFVLLIICVYGIRVFIGFLTSHRNDDTPRSKRKQMVMNYYDIEEE